MNINLQDVHEVHLYFDSAVVDEPHLQVKKRLWNFRGYVKLDYIIPLNLDLRSSIEVEHMMDKSTLMSSHIHKRGEDLSIPASNEVGPSTTIVGPSTIASIARNSYENDDELVDGYETEELRSIHSDEEGDEYGEGRYPTFNPADRVEDNQPSVIILGMELKNLEVFKTAVRDLNIYLGREVDYTKNDKQRVRAKCVERKKKDDASCKICEGEKKKQYERLRDYANELRKQNPGSTIMLQAAAETHEFERLYICLEACKKGFLAGCKPLIGLDGCLLKGYYGEQLFAVVSQDENNSFYLIAFAIVEVENTENWTWFLRLLLDDLEDPQGLDAALEAICPHAPHRYCCRHIPANPIKKWKNQADLKNAFWACAKSSTPQQFEEAMNVRDKREPEIERVLEERSRRPPRGCGWVVAGTWRRPSIPRPQISNAFVILRDP
ncbi:hypothetical protein CRG98_008578 [Punica granatum]|uniref:MULE transposase domain-containing protein n=1 Tax=Punica granatum TaxID=22663 RepID=A0A2I0KRA4_PUNGR|nr:hypothetical protein CRG98_008578 [Punica granatum]